LAPEPQAAVTPAPGAAAGGGLSRALHGLVRWETALTVLLVVVFGLGAKSSDEFLSSYNLFTLCTNIGDLAIMALPLTLIIIIGEIDLSIASILALAAETLGYLAMHHWPMGLIMLTVLVLGALAGALNGFLITVVGLPSLAVTIGTLTLYRGLATVILGPLTVSDFPEAYTNLGVNSPFGLPWLSYSVLAFFILAVIFGIVLRMTRFGRGLYAIGLNSEAAQHAGIRVNRVKMQLFVLSGVICAAVGMLYTFELSSAGENIGIGFELEVVTIVLLGGVSIFGGRGTILGVSLAAFIYAGLHSSLLLSSGFDDNDFLVVSGGLLILSVAIQNTPLYLHRVQDWRRRRRARRRSLASERSA
jgi:rhamnose transport system permease protein